MTTVSSFAEWFHLYIDITKVVLFCVLITFISSLALHSSWVFSAFVQCGNKNARLFLFLIESKLVNS